MGDIASHSSSNYTVPSWLVHRIELCLDYLSDVVEYSFLLKSEGDTVDGVLLHLVTHIATFNDCVLGLLLVLASVCCRFMLSVNVWLPFIGSFNAWVCLSTWHITFNL